MEKLVHKITDYFNGIPRPENWVIKLISLFFALFLWYFVAGEDKVNMSVSIPVEIVNLPSDLTISNQFKRELEVTMSGQRSLIKSLPKLHISRLVDFSKAVPGKVVIQNGLDSISVPRGISVIRIQPASVTFLIERLVRKDMPIKAITRGRPAKGYDLVSLDLEPATVHIIGPESVLAGESNLITSPIDISGLKKSTIKEVTLDLKPAIADLIGEQVATATINIVQKTEKRTINDIPIEFMPEQRALAGGGSFNIIPKFASVQAVLPYELARNSKDLKTLFKARVNTDNLASGHLLEVMITAPPSVKILEHKPHSVILVLKKKHHLKIRYQ